MNRNKGITMISLIISIIVTLIILGLSYRIGVRYIRESRDQEKDTLTTVISNSVTRRQNDNYAGIESAKSYYAGYHLSSGDFFKIATLFDDKSDVYAPGLWYVLDSYNANDLGVKDTEKYLVADLNNPTDTKGKFIAVVNYFTGVTHLVEYKDVDALEGVDVSLIAKEQEPNHPNDHEPVWTVVTCTEDSVCKICGYKQTDALGHDFGYGPNDIYSPDKMTHATCTEDLKCVRCGYIKEKATGHNYDTTRYISLRTGAQGHYNPCINVDLNNNEVCGAPGHLEKHTLSYVSVTASNPWKHNITCTVGCGYSELEACDVKVKQKNKVVHTLYCDECKREEDVAHDDIKYRYIDKRIHEIYCATCNEILGNEEHVDIEEPFGVCDKCNGILDLEQVPEITVIMYRDGEGLSEEQKYLAKCGHIVKVVITSNVRLGTVPTIKIQGQQIKVSDISNTPNTNEYIATINTGDLESYQFVEGLLTIEVSNIRSLWGIRANTVTETSDGKYIDYDPVPPEYIYLPNG